MEECAPCPDFTSFTLAFALQLRKKQGKTSVIVQYQNSHTVQNPHKHTHYKTHTHTHILQNTYTHILQNNIKPPQYKLKQNVVCFLLGNSPSSEFYMPTFRNTLFNLHRQLRDSPTCLWRWNRQIFPKRRHIKFRSRRITQKKRHNLQITAKVWNQE
jgi:hypothetical protein